MKTTTTFEHGIAMWAVQIVEQGPQPVICFCQTQDQASAISEAINALETLSEMADEQRDLFNRFMEHAQVKDTPENHCWQSSINGGYLCLKDKPIAHLNNIAFVNQ